MKRRFISAPSLAVIALVTILGAFAPGCGGGGSTGPVSINSLDGQTGIPVGSTFQYTFTGPLSTGTVTSGSFFIVPTPAPAAQAAKVAVDDTICNPANGLAAAISCSSFNWCTLDPAEDLAGGALYSICLLSEIDYSNGTPFEGFMATFTTEGVAPTLKLIRLDGTKMELTEKPIPLRVSIEATFPAAVGDPAAVEAAMHITDEKGNAVAGTLSWNGDNTALTFSPSTNLRYRATYDVTFDSSSAAASVVKTATLDQTFTTMTEGDVNGDGRSDILVSANNLSRAPIMSAGAVYVFNGATLGSTTTVNDALAMIFGEDNKTLGQSIAMAGDVNADGYDDIIFSTQYGDHGAITNTGTVYIFSGKDLNAASTLASAFSTIYGTADGDSLGNTVSGIGDFNNDGYADVAACAIKANNNFRGDAYIFSGSDLQPTMTATQAMAKMSGAADHDAFGDSIASIGDVNDDGFGDFIVGASSVAVGGNLSAGKAYIFSGQTMSSSSTIGDAISTIVNATPKADALFGSSSSGAGDVNGDGAPDFIVGANSDNGDPGFVYAFSGKDLQSTMTTANAFAAITGAAVDDGFGSPAVGIGDVNGDGFDDVGIGSCCTGAGNDEGAAYIFSGAALSGAIGTGAAFATISAANAGDYLGDIGGVGDFDGDGKPDIVVGASGYQAMSGIAYVFTGASLGSSTTLANALVGIAGESAGAQMGYRVGSTYR